MLTAEEIANLPYRRGVGVVLVNPRGLIFVGRRIDQTQEAWQMPQGGVDEGEKSRRAALRELEEETGITSDLVSFVAKIPERLTYDLPPDLVGTVWGGKYRGQKQRWFLFRYLGRDDQINLATAHPEFSGWRWLDADTMLSSIVPFKRALYEEVVAAFRSHLA